MSEVSKAEQVLVAAFVEAWKAATSRQAGITLAFFAMPLLDRESAGAMQERLAPHFLAGVKAETRRTHPKDDPETLEAALEIAGSSALKSYGQTWAKLKAVAMSQNPKVLAIREQYAKGMYPVGIEAAYALARGKRSDGPGASKQTTPVEKVEKALREATPEVKVAAILSVYASLTDEDRAKVKAGIVAADKSNTK